jgi:hypothetical protein
MDNGKWLMGNGESLTANGQWRAAHWSPVDNSRFSINHFPLTIFHFPFPA